MSGAGRLTKIAEVLGVPVGSFFSGKEMLESEPGRDRRRGLAA